MIKRLTHTHMETYNLSVVFSCWTAEWSSVVTSAALHFPPYTGHRLFHRWEVVGQRSPPTSPTAVPSSLMSSSLNLSLSVPLQFIFLFLKKQRTFFSSSQWRADWHVISWVGRVKHWQITTYTDEQQTWSFTWGLYKKNMMAKCCLHIHQSKWSYPNYTLPLSPFLVSTSSSDKHDSFMA